MGNSQSDYPSSHQRIFQSHENAISIAKPHSNSQLYHLKICSFTNIKNYSSCSYNSHILLTIPEGLRIPCSKSCRQISKNEQWLQKSSTLKWNISIIKCGFEDGRAHVQRYVQHIRYSFHTNYRNYNAFRLKIFIWRNRPILDSNRFLSSKMAQLKNGKMQQH